MKKILMSAIVLFLFSASILLFQISCSKIEAQTNNNIVQLNKILYTDFDGKIWLANYDGTGASQVNIAFPANVLFDASSPRLSLKISPDGTKLFFSGRNTSTNETGIYSCDLTGNNVQTVFVTSGNSQPILCGVY